MWRYGPSYSISSRERSAQTTFGGTISPLLTPTCANRWQVHPAVENGTTPTATEHATLVIQVDVPGHRAWLPTHPLPPPAQFSTTTC